MSDNGDNLRPGDQPNADQSDYGVEEEGSTYRTGTDFDPTPYFRRLRGRAGAQDYLDVRIRLLWLRREHPDAEIVTEHVQIDDKSAIFKATVTLPSGGKATGYGSETAGDFADFIEKAETKAIGRALNALGYGAQFVEENREEEAPDASASRPEPEPRPTPRPAKTQEPAARATPPTPMAAQKETPERQEPHATSPGSAPIDISAGRDRPAPSTAGPSLRVTPEPQTPQAATPSEEEPALEDYSWTAFWHWARPLGFQNRGAIEALIGRPITDLNPAQVRDLIREKRGEE